MKVDINHDKYLDIGLETKLLTLEQLIEKLQTNHKNTYGLWSNLYFTHEGKKYRYVLERLDFERGE